MSNNTTLTAVDPEVHWEDPANPDATYFQDAMHFPFPLSPLFQSSFAPGMRTGFTAALRHYNAPLERFDLVYRNNYHFERYVPIIPKDEADAQAIEALAKETFQAALPGMRQRWQEDHLPALLLIQDELRSIADSSPDTVATVENVEAVVSAIRETWTHHFKVVLPMMLAMQLFDEFFVELFGDEADSHKLLVGMESESVISGYVMADLATEAERLGLKEVILRTPVDDIPAALVASEAGRTFAASMQTAMERYGLRQDLFDYVVPTWLEDPTVPLLQIRNYLETGRDNRAETARLVQVAAAATTSAREALALYPEAARGQFEAFLGFSRDAMFLQEEHNFYIDQQIMALVRLAFMNIGRALVTQGLIETPEDIFLLTTEQLLGAIAGSTQNTQDLVRAAKVDQERSNRLAPPPFVGPPPQGPPPSGDPLSRGITRFFGALPQDTGDPATISGNAGSRGEVTGEAFVAVTLEAASSIQPGQILVTITTMPPWTPLFGVAAGVVTETGGPLSHCAIVAREYEIPAVVGAKGAVRRIKTGQRITVDGSNGLVTLHD